MYYPVPNGSVETIQGYECQLPPLGYGKNRRTGELEHVGVIKGHLRKEKQKWQRIELPADWDKKRKAEQLRQKDDPEHYDPDLEKVRLLHWKYRLCGIWIMVNGSAIYIPPSYYMYLQWCPLDVGYPKFRIPDLHFFMIWEHCVEDPRCAGLVDIERRRMGKTYKSGCILLDRTSMEEHHHGGIQSKTGMDAKAVFMKTVVSFFKKWPDFFRPVFDTSKGLAPSSELRFFQTSLKGKRAEQIIDAPELESWVDWGTAETFYYDGSKLNSYVMDEFGKTMEVSVWDRWQVVRFCMDQDGQWVGKALLTSTIEEMETGGEEAQKIWRASNPADRNANGRTQSGLYRFFLPAYETTFFDEYGYPEIEKAKRHYLNERAGLIKDPRALSSQIRKNPFSIEEAFRIDGDRCLYDSMKLNEQLDWLSWKENITEQGNFEWKNGERFTEVIWTKKNNGRWEIPTGFKIDDPNKVIKNNMGYCPQNNLKFVMGCDPFKYDKVKDNRRSDCAAFAFQKYGNQEDIFNECFVCRYSYRAPTTAMQYEDILKMAWYFGCQVLFESNIDNWKLYFKDARCEAFLMKLPGEDDYGLYSDGKGRTHQTICDLTEDHIERCIKKVFFKSLLNDWLKFDVAKTTFFDEAMASGYTLIAANRKTYRRQGDVGKELTEYFKIYKAV